MNLLHSPALPFPLSWSREWAVWIIDAHVTYYMIHSCTRPYFPLARFLILYHAIIIICFMLLCVRVNNFFHSAVSNSVKSVPYFICSLWMGSDTCNSATFAAWLTNLNPFMHHVICASVHKNKSYLCWIFWPHSRWLGLSSFLQSPPSPPSPPLATLKLPTKPAPFYQWTCFLIILRYVTGS